MHSRIKLFESDEMHDNFTEVPEGGKPTKRYLQTRGTTENFLLENDVETGNQARALHRVVRAMHDGECPACGAISPSEKMRVLRANKFIHSSGATKVIQVFDWACPVCGFEITNEQAEAAIAEFRPHMKKNFDVFLDWQRKFEIVAKIREDVNRGKKTLPPASGPGGTPF